MALALSAVMRQMVAWRQAWLYPDVVVIAIATFTFVTLALAIRGAAGIRGIDSRALATSRAIGLSKALVQLFFLETTMIAVFGSDEGFRFAMEAVTGVVVFLAVVAVAIGLIVASGKAGRS